MLVPLTLLLVTCLALGTRLSHNFRATTTMEPPQYDDEPDHANCPTTPPKEQFRVRFGTGPGTDIMGWPSKGGVYVLRDCDGVDFDFLHLDRFNNTPRSLDAAAEDIHCAGMRKLGATWWESKSAFDYSYLMELQTSYSESKRLLLIVGWPPAGGVWVLKTNFRSAIDIGVGRIKNAFSMEERCRAIEQLGGKFYPDPRECPDLDL